MGNNKFSPAIGDEARRLIGLWIKSRRKELGWSQAKLAEIAGIRQGTVKDLELGRNYEINTLVSILGSMRGKLFIEWADINSIAGIDINLSAN